MSNMLRDWHIRVLQKLNNNPHSVTEVSVLPFDEDCMPEECSSSSWGDRHWEESGRISHDEALDILVDLQVPTLELAKVMMIVADSEDGYSFTCQKEWGVRIPRVAYNLEDWVDHIFDKDEHRRLMEIYNNKKWVKDPDEFELVFRTKTYEDQVFREIRRL